MIISPSFDLPKKTITEIVNFEFKIYRHHFRSINRKNNYG